MGDTDHPIVCVRPSGLWKVSPRILFPGQSMGSPRANDETLDSFHHALVGMRGRGWVFARRASCDDRLESSSGMAVGGWGIVGLLLSSISVVMSPSPSCMVHGEADALAN